MGMTPQALYTWICGFSVILLCRSSQALSGWMGNVGVQVSPEIFDWGLWLGHSRKFTELSLSHSSIVLAVCLGSLSCWKGKKTPPQHDAATTMLHCWDGIGQVMSGAWFPPDMTLRIEAKQLNLGFITPKNLVSHNLRVLFACFLATLSGLSCVFQ